MSRTTEHIVSRTSSNLNPFNLLSNEEVLARMASRDLIAEQAKQGLIPDGLYLSEFPLVLGALPEVITGDRAIHHAISDISKNYDYFHYIVVESF